MNMSEIIAEMILLMIKVKRILSEDCTPTDALNFIIKTVEEKIEILKQEEPN